ncbi:MAG: rhomboid family intramembrane serine protease [Roseibacillus sp.]|nr:rhomboid family intramembrane serine protease [Roseibacillus sp.]
MRRPSFLPRISLHRPGFDILTLLCLVLLVVHVVVVVGGEVVGGGVKGLVAAGFYETIGLSRPGVLAGKGWQFLTYPFFHGNWPHLLLNWMVIYMIGGRVLHILGMRAFTRIFFGGALGGGLLHVLLFPSYPLGEGITPPHLPLVGASGGMMALLMALVSLSPDSRMWPLMVSGRNLGRGLMFSTLILFLLTPGLKIPVLEAAGQWLASNGEMGPLFQVSHICHFGGGLVGMLYAHRLLRKSVSLEDLRRDRKRREGVGA